MNSTDRYKILQNIVAQQGVEADLYAELAKAEQMINAIDQGKMIPPPVPPELTQPAEEIAPNPEQTNTMEGKYDNI